VNAFASLLDQPIARALGWALLDFLWQGAAVAAVFAVALTLTRRSQVRYLLGCATMGILLLLPIWTTIGQTPGFDRAPTASSTLSIAAAAPRSIDAGSQSAAVRHASAGAALGYPVSASRAPEPTGANRLEPMLPWLVGIWLTGVAVLSIRLLGGWAWTVRLSRCHVRPVDAALERSLSEIARRVGVARAVRVLESAAVQVPTVVGWIRPVILLPAAALSGLAPWQLEAILAHELAHVRRHDFLVNLLQTAVETLLFYHPAVWWVSRCVRAEREHCCDEIAVAACGDAVSYAMALTELEGVRHARGQLALAASGGSLLERVKRLLGTAPSDSSRFAAALAGIAAIAAIVVVGANPPRQTGSATRAREPQKPARAVAIVSPPPESTIDDLAAATTRAKRTLEASARALESQLADRTLTEGARAEIARALEAQQAAVRNIQRESEEAIAAALAESASTRAAATEAILAARAMAHTSTTPVLAAQAPAPGPAASASTSLQLSDDTGSFQVSWSDNGYKVSLKGRGRIELSDDDTSIKSISPGGYLTIVEQSGASATRLEVEPGADGQLRYRYYTGGGWFSRGREQAFDAEGRAWLARFLPEVIRRTGLAAEARVARILARGGPGAVLDEISKIPSDYVKRIYFDTLIAQAELDAAAVQRVLRQAGAEIGSDFELATLLTKLPTRYLEPEGSRAAFVEAVRSIGSDFEQRRALNSLLDRGGLTAPVAVAFLETATGIASDFEQAELLIKVAAVHAVDEAVRPAFFAAVDTLGSDFERRRVLSAVLKRGDLSPTILRAVLEAGAKTSSDFELAELLLAVAKRGPLPDVARDAFFKAVDEIGSDFEHRRVLDALVKQPGAGQATITAVLHSAAGISSDFELAELLLAIIRTHGADPALRAAFIQAADSLQSDHEHGRVMSAFVRAER
jgi:beta-lactamase regulating signal transducer with metallopeptidase domain